MVLMTDYYCLYACFTAIPSAAPDIQSKRLGGCIQLPQPQRKRRLKEHSYLPRSWSTAKDLRKNKAMKVLLAAPSQEGLKLSNLS